MQLASLDGRIGPAQDATIPVTDEGLLRGDAAFEVVRLYAGRPFALGEHLGRLRSTCLGLRLEHDHTVLAREIDALLDEAGSVEGLLRVVLTRGGRRLLIIEPLPVISETARVMTITYSPNRILDGLKTVSYAANMLAGRLAREQGADEALFVTPHGGVLEGPTWSFFWVEGGNLLTPPLTDRILASITRARVLQTSEVRERSCTRENLERAEEAFIASTVREVLPIASIDGRELPEAPGPVTLAAQAALTDCIERELEAGA
jgi:branched-chain amino acid aminotransferase